MHVTHVTDEGVMIGTEFLPASTVIWTAGVKASAAGTWLEAETDQQGRVLVQSDLSVPGAPNVFVIGDTAHVTQQGKALPGLSPVALQEARYVADLITNRVHGKPPMGPFHYVNKGMLATVGRGFAIAAVGPLHLWGLPGWLFWVGVHLFYLIGFRNRLLVMIQYTWAYLTFQPGARIILPADSIPSRQEQASSPSIGPRPTIPAHCEAV